MQHIRKPSWLLAGLSCLVLTFRISAQADAADTPAATQPAATSPATTSVAVDFDQRWTEIKFNSTPLAEAIQSVSKKSGASITVEWDELHRAGIEKSSPVTARLLDIKLIRLLELIGKSVEGEGPDQKIGLIVDQENAKIVLTTIPGTVKHQTTKTYLVSDLLDKISSVEQLKKYLIDNVAPHSWKDGGGNGEITVQFSPPKLLITQLPQNHKLIAAALEQLKNPTPP